MHPVGALVVGFVAGGLFVCWRIVCVYVYLSAKPLED